MFGLIEQLFKGILVFGFPLLMALCVWIILEPATFWQNLVSLIFVVIVASLSFVAVCLVLNDSGE